MINEKKQNFQSLNKVEKIVSAVEPEQSTYSLDQ